MRVTYLIKVASAGQCGERVAIMAPPNRHYVEATWGTWLARGIAVPLCLSHPDRCMPALSQCSSRFSWG